MSEPLELEAFLSTMGVAFSVISNIAPIPGVYAAWRKRNVETLSHSYLIVSAVSAFLWVMYGIRSLNSAIIPNNGFSVIINSIYLLAYHVITNDPLTFSFKLMSGLMAIAVTFVKFIDVETLGTCCMFGGLLLYAAPVEKLGIVYKQKDASYIDPNITISNLLCSGTWALYAILAENFYIFLPNFCGFILCVT